MYLTRFRFNTARAGARRLLTSPQMMHAAVLASFAEPAPEGEAGAARTLWRVDHKTGADVHQVHLYLVSPGKPDLTHLVEQAGWPTTGTWETHDYSAFLGRLAVGQTWAFRLTANPVHSIRRKDGEPTKPTAHVTPHHQTGWLLQRQEAAGFRVLERAADGVDRGEWPEGSQYELLVHGRSSRTFGKTERATGRKNRVPLVSVTFDGRLEITDADALRRTLTTGLGRAKAYGCGLLTLAPAARTPR